MISHHYHCARVYVFRAAAHIPNTRYEDEEGEVEKEKEEGANGEVGEEADEQSVPYSDSPSDNLLSSPLCSRSLYACFALPRAGQGILHACDNM